jgi:hypothetical protein
MNKSLCNIEGCENFGKYYRACGHKPEEPKKRPVKKKQAKPIANVSKKQARRLRKYSKVRDKQLENIPYCQYPMCGKPATEFHHAGGRIGEDLFKGGVSLCNNHHRWAEEHPEEAKLLGLSKSRLTNSKFNKNT